MKKLFLFNIFIISNLWFSCKIRMPVENKEFKDTKLVELISLDTSLHLDIRYATKNNFIKTKVYEESRAFLQEEAAFALINANKQLSHLGYGIIIYDAYRPWSVTKIFWEYVPKENRKFVANPKNGSRHNRGCAIDVSLYNLKTGVCLKMPSEYDEPTERSNPNYGGGTLEERTNRDILRRIMEENNFKVYENEWWHFDYNGWENYKVLNIPFNKINNYLSN